MGRKKQYPKPKGKSDGGKKKKSKVVNVNKRVIKQLQLSSRVSNLEKQLEALLNNKKNEAQFQAGLMFGVNALVDVLQAKNVITMEELETARIKTIQEYQQEKVAEAKREEVIERRAKQAEASQAECEEVIPDPTEEHNACDGSDHDTHVVSEVGAPDTP